MADKSVLDWVALVLVIVGGVNWGLVGALQMDLVATVLGAGSMLARVVYVLIGLSALYTIYYLFK